MGRWSDSYCRISISGVTTCAAASGNFFGRLTESAGGNIIEFYIFWNQKPILNKEENK